MIRGTIARIGGDTMRQGPRPGFALLDCPTSRRSTVMCALLRATVLTTVYQRDSSSKRPRASVVSAARPPTKSLRTLPQLWTLESAPTASWKTQNVFHSYRRHSFGY
jgi:hypothetical protein